MHSFPRFILHCTASLIFLHCSPVMEPLCSQVLPSSSPTYTLTSTGTVIILGGNLSSWAWGLVPGTKSQDLSVHYLHELFRFQPNWTTTLWSFLLLLLYLKHLLLLEYLHTPTEHCYTHPSMFAQTPIAPPRLGLLTAEEAVPPFSM